ncbi:MAG: molybdopterin-dependent oxidoreductase [Acidimicrobiales bacterium]|nr:molybdopterin-dependent oxidoreductase [Acidimicrobiales bacterium]
MTERSRTVLGTCHHDCPDSCGWVVTVEGERAVKLRGNPDHPYSRGELCPKVNRFLDRVYSPDRVLTPLRRVGAKGEGRFEPTTWDDALATIAVEWSGRIARHGGETLLGYHSAGTQGLIQMTSLDRRLFAVLGASRLDATICGSTARVGVELTNGTGLGPDPLDIVHSRFIILWGTNTRLTNRHLWPFIEQARSQGATVVVIDPLRTITADSADWFVQPLPGTDAALVLGLAHVLIRDGLVDEGWVRDHTVGYEALTERVRAWDPVRAAAHCGVAAEEIERLARAYGSARPALIRTLIGAEHHEHGAELLRTMACLPALVGAWRDAGGGLIRSSGTWTEEALLDTVLPAGAGTWDTRRINMGRIGAALTDPALAPPITALYVWNANPAVTAPNAGLVQAGLAREDLFTVVHEQFLTDTARYADLVLPATTQLEHLDVVPAWGHLYLGWNEPAIAPLGEARSNTEVFRSLATALGRTEAWLHDSDEELIAQKLDLDHPRLATITVEGLRREGFQRLDVASPLVPYAEGGFPTPSGKVELASPRLAELGLDPLPGYTPAVEGPEGDAALRARFPLQLLTPKTHPAFLNSTYSASPRHAPPGGPFVELDPVDAAARGVAEGDEVIVANDRGRLRLRARLTGRVRPGVVAIPFGWWDHQHAGRYGANALTSDRLADAGGGIAFSDTLVEVRRA